MYLEKGIEEGKCGRLNHGACGSGRLIGGRLIKREEEGVHLSLEGRGGVFWEWLVGTGV